ncbi:serine protease inhibitor dipetalogastin-like [Condylostylus longicornis]|uniref:serine protease inhibitor dipetalogastin-like n=1 Tax=Condylostylus longicornis TaxID=2530218 RepID=UPI00244E46D2|nr:serine protease inhibitor dipetalogastin-like [Condylostylus longicornis]
MKTLLYLFAILIIIPNLCSSQDCICTFDYNPVCGSNGVTYSNTCFWGCANSKATREEFAPICGTDGKTYLNSCILGCTNRDKYLRKQPTVGIVHNGLCEGAYDFRNRTKI